MKPFRFIWGFICWLFREVIWDGLTEPMFPSSPPKKPAPAPPPHHPTPPAVKEWWETPEALPEPGAVIPYYLIPMYKRRLERKWVADRASYQCGWCRFWKLERVTCPSGIHAEGKCCRRPIGVQKYSDDWCGEFEERK